MFPSAPTHPVCSVRRHPDGGFTPVLHLSDRPAPEATRHGVALPTIAEAVRYARGHYATFAVLVHQECCGGAAA